MSLQALIIEDDVALRVIYETVLLSMGFEVLHAEDGAEAIALLDHVQPAIILLDMLLPKVDGSQVLAYIRADPYLHHVPVVIVTAHNRFRPVLQLTTNNRFLTKPVRPHDIQQAVQQVLATY
jgi:CheY-like chemotaxis protein